MRRGSTKHRTIRKTLLHIWNELILSLCTSPNGTPRKMAAYSNVIKAIGQRDTNYFSMESMRSCKFFSSSIQVPNSSDSMEGIAPVLVLLAAQPQTKYPKNTHAKKIANADTVPVSAHCTIKATKLPNTITTHSWW